ncbi:hypothetical protein B1B04_08220 [Lysinibacillus sp. KCTC 33748]|nr:hypothetical protein B1B04_08220 [Lysinibacillus sp. KCTC 33748]
MYISHMVCIVLTDPIELLIFPAAQLLRMQITILHLEIQEVLQLIRMCILFTHMKKEGGTSFE